MYLAVREGLTWYKRRANQNVLNNYMTFTFMDISV